MSYNFEVMSQNVGGKKYVVRLVKEICLASSSTINLSAVWYPVDARDTV
jgi:hypothetical protein